jgi:16S rRNA (guanine527-N7)-methyltransferase
MSGEASAQPDVENPESDYGAASFARDMGSSSSELHDLRAFRDLIEDESARMNLVGPSALGEFWRRHALDSAQLFHVEQPDQVWLDVGAGAGFPGVVLAILAKHRSCGRVHLVESMGKRVRFLETVVRTLRLPAQIHPVRAEELKPPPDVTFVTARACAPLPRLFGYTEHFFRAGAQGMFLKGRGVESELTEARQTWTFVSRLTPSRSDPDGRVLTVERLARRAR